MTLVDVAVVILVPCALVFAIAITVFVVTLAVSLVREVADGWRKP